MDKVERIIVEEYELDGYSKEKLHKRLECIENLEFDELIKNLETNVQKRDDFIGELNVICQLYETVKAYDAKSIWEYEKEINGKTPDLFLTLKGHKVCLQLKKKAISARENKNRKVIRYVDNRLQKSTYSKTISISIPEALEFSDKDVIYEGIVKHIGEQSESNIITLSDDRYVEIEVIGERKGDHIIIVTGNQDWINITDEVKGHLEGALLKATESITWRKEEGVLTGIVMISSRSNLIDIGDVLYGTEGVAYKNSKSYGVRDSNGLLSRKDFSDKIDFVVIMVPKQESIIDSYTPVLLKIGDMDYDSIVKALGVCEVYDETPFAI